MSSIGATALAQLTHKVNAEAAAIILKAFLGAKDITLSGYMAEFRFTARAKNGANVCRIVLDPSDTYTVEFFSKRGAKVTGKGQFSDIYAEDLKPLFERETGLYLSLR